jgi:hypothetical protein
MIRHIIIAAALVALAISGPSSAQVGAPMVPCLGPGPCFVGPGVPNNAGQQQAGIAGALLLEDGASILLLEDGSSHLCLEGGC